MPPAPWLSALVHAACRAMFPAARAIFVLHDGVAAARAPNRAADARVAGGDAIDLRPP